MLWNSCIKWIYKIIYSFSCSFIYIRFQSMARFRKVVCLRMDRCVWRRYPRENMLLLFCCKYSLLSPFLVPGKNTFLLLCCTYYIYFLLYIQEMIRYCFCVVLILYIFYISRKENVTASLLYLFFLSPFIYPGNDTLLLLCCIYSVSFYISIKEYVPAFLLYLFFLSPFI